MAYVSHQVLKERSRAAHVITGLAALRRQYCEKYEGDSVAWAYDVARVGDVEFKGQKGLDPKQAEILAATDRHKLVGVAGAKGVGKEYIASLVALKFLATYGFSRVPCASVTGGQMRGALWPEIQMRIAASPILRQLLDWTPTQVVVRGLGADGLPLAPRWRIYLTAAAARQSDGGSSSEAEGGQGVHADNLLLIITEASGWGYAVWRAKLDTLTGQNNRAFVIGNPVRPQGPFYDVFHKPLIMQHWARFHIAASESRAVEPDSLQRMIDTYGRESSYVQANGFGLFPTAGSERSIYSHAEVVAAFEREVEDDPAVDLQLGCDVARFGFDRTVVHTRRGWRSLSEAWMAKSDVVETALLCVTEAARWWKVAHDAPRKLDRFRTREEADAVVDGWPELSGVRDHALIVVDDSGVGGGVTDSLKAWGWRAAPMNNGWTASKPQFYSNRGAELWMVDGKQAIAQCRLPYSDELLKQLTEREYRFTGKKEQRMLLSKEAMKSQGEGSPDHGDAFTLAYADVRGGRSATSLVRVVGRSA